MTQHDMQNKPASKQEDATTVPEVNVATLLHQELSPGEDTLNSEIDELKQRLRSSRHYKTLNDANSSVKQPRNSRNKQDALNASDKIPHECTKDFSDPRDKDYGSQSRHRQLVLELRLRHRQEVEQLDGLIHKLRSQLLTAREEHSVCQARLARTQQVAARSLHQQQLRRHTRVQHLTAECERLRRAQLSQQQELACQILPVNRQNAALEQKLQLAEKEAGARQQHEQLLRQQLQHQLLGARRQLTDTAAQTKTAELDKSRLTTRNQWLEERVQHLQQEQLQERRAARASVTSQQHLQQQLADAKYRHQQQITQMQSQIEHQTGEMERERLETDRQLQQLRQQLAETHAQLHRTNTMRTVAETHALTQAQTASKCQHSQLTSTQTQQQQQMVASLNGDNCACGSRQPVPMIPEHVASNSAGVMTDQDERHDVQEPSQCVNETS